jgi:hypothetical protein
VKDAEANVRRMREMRRARRRAGLCAQCGVKSKVFYRCAECREGHHVNRGKRRVAVREEAC